MLNAVIVIINKSPGDTRMINYGLKLWSTDVELLDEAFQSLLDDLFQYIEVTCVPGSSIEPFLDHWKGKWIIHAPTDRFGFNPGDPTKRNDNKKMIAESIEWANKLGAKRIIVHPGFGSIEEWMQFITSVHDDRVHIENMPYTGLEGQRMLGYDVKGLEPAMHDFCTHMHHPICLDISHAIKAAIGLKVDIKKFLGEFERLYPNYFHISDARLSNEMDEHLNIGEGEYDFSIVKLCINPKAVNFVTLETPKVKPHLGNDIRNMFKLRLRID